MGVTLASYVAAETAAAWLVSVPLSTALRSSAATTAGSGDPTPEPGADGAALDDVSLWLLTNDALPEEATRRLEELSQRTADETRLR